MKKLAWGAVLLCMFSGASLAQDPPATGTSNTAGGASNGAVPTGGGISTNTAIVITATVITVGTVAVFAAIASSGNGATPSTTNH